MGEGNALSFLPGERWGGGRVADGGAMSITPGAHDPSGPPRHLPIADFAMGR
jgi:hypothetical protein